MGALARLGLARAYALQGDTVKARAAYQDFLTLLERRRPGRSHPEASQSGILEIGIVIRTGQRKQC